MKDMHMCCLIVDHTPGSPNPQNLQKCDCVLLAITEEDTVDLTDARTKSPQNIGLIILTRVGPEPYQSEIRQWMA